MNGLEVVQNITIASQMRLDKSHNLPQIRLAKIYNLTIPRIDLNMSSDIKLIRKLAKSLIEISKKVHKPKTYDKAINNLIYGNR